MKKIFLFLPIFFFCFSCSESDDLTSSIAKDNASRPGPVINRIDPTKLARIIFRPQTALERVWFFYPNGLLKKITKHDGALVQTFTYDANSNLIKTVYISEGWLPSYTNTYTYDSSNKIATINGSAVMYDAVANKYIIGNPANPNHTDINLTNELTFLSIREYFQETDDNGNVTNQNLIVETASYLNSNLAGYYVLGSPSSSFFSHDTKNNPLKAALYPINKAYSVRCNFNHTSGLWKYSECNSQNNVINEHYESEDPERYNYIYEYNALNLPVKQTTQTYEFSHLESTQITAKYYYQGDAIPNN